MGNAKSELPITAKEFRHFRITCYAHPPRFSRESTGTDISPSISLSIERILINPVESAIDEQKAGVVGPEEFRPDLLSVNRSLERDQAGLRLLVAQRRVPLRIVSFRQGHRLRCRRGRKTLLDPYGATDPAEFFAVVTECFFDSPRAMLHEYRPLYELFRDYYRQDPANWPAFENEEN